MKLKIYHALKYSCAVMVSVYQVEISKREVAASKWQFQVRILLGEIESELYITCPMRPFSDIALAYGNYFTHSCPLKSGLTAEYRASGPHSPKLFSLLKVFIAQSMTILFILKYSSLSNCILAMQYFFEVMLEQNMHSYRSREPFMNMLFETFFDHVTAKLDVT